MNGICLPLLIINSPTAIHIKTDNKNKPAQICFYSKRPHTITKKYDNISMDSTIAGSLNIYSNSSQILKSKGSVIDEAIIVE